MCRLYALLANEPTKVECRLVNAQNALLDQCRNDVSGNLHAEGWGVVCYDEFDRFRIPTTVKHSNVSFGSNHFSHSVQNIYSKAIVAHVRRATVGSASTLNSHPFTFDEWTFAHNGTIPSFEKISKLMESNMGVHYKDCRLGTTDSELLFLWILYQLEANDINSNNLADKQDEARDLLSSSISALANDCLEMAPADDTQLNFVLTNGHVMFACRWNNPMYKIVREGTHDCEVCQTPHMHHSQTVDYRAVAIASEPITSESWTEIPNHSLMYVSSNLTCAIDKIPHNNFVGK